MKRYSAWHRYSSACVCVCVLGALGLGCGHAGKVVIESRPATVELSPSGLYPETVVADPTSGGFLFGSFRQGAIYRTSAAGYATRLVDDPRLCSVLGIAVDAEHGRLWAVNADLGVSVKPSAQGPKQLAAVGVYDLKSGAPIDYFELESLVDGPHLLNGIALDDAGKAYVTDSFAPVIYQLERGMKPRVLVHDERFRGEGVNLNGVVVHPDGYLLVIKKSDGGLFKVQLAQPAQVSPVALDAALVGGDGLLLTGPGYLAVVANQTPSARSNAFITLESRDDWRSATTRHRLALGASYPTTAALRGGDVYVVSSRLNELIASTAEQRPLLAAPATLRRVATVGR